MGKQLLGKNRNSALFVFVILVIIFLNPVSGTNPPPPPPAGFSASSELINFYSMTTAEAQTFVNLIDAQGFTEVTLRLNAMYEWDSGQPSSAGVAKAAEIITLCQAVDIDVNIDLHTWYTTWDNSFRDSATGAATNRATYLTYIQNTVTALSSSPVKTWMVLNEPQARTASATENQFIRDCIARAKQHTSKPVSVRFMCGYSPSTGHYASDIDDLCDFMCRNTYWDPRSPGTTVYGTSQTTMNSAISIALQKNKQLWITEFGKTNTNQSEQAAYIRAFNDYANGSGIDATFAWVMQPENPSAESYNLFGESYQPLPAFYEIKP